MRTNHHPVPHVAPALVQPTMHPGAAGHPGLAPANAQTHSQFHQQRAGVLRQMPRPTPAQSQNAQRNRTAQQARSAAEPENALMLAIANAERSGTGDDEAMPDGMERVLSARLDDKAGPAGVDVLQCDEAVDATPDEGALKQLRERLGGGAEIGGASALDDALALAGRMAAPGKGTLAERVADLRRSAAQDPAMRRHDLDGVQVWMAQRQAASINLLVSCLEQGAGLHAQLRGNGLLDKGDDGKGLSSAERTGLGLLEAGRAAGGAALLTHLGAVGGQGRDGRKASQMVAATLRTLPHELWATKEARGKLLQELDQDAGEGAAPAQGADRTERQLRASQENRHA
jgi:hypothetical protein